MYLKRLINIPLYKLYNFIQTLKYDEIGLISAQYFRTNRADVYTVNVLSFNKIRKTSKNI